MIRFGKVFVYIIPSLNRAISVGFVIIYFSSNLLSSRILALGLGCVLCWLSRSAKWRIIEVRIGLWLAYNWSWFAVAWMTPGSLIWFWWSDKAGKRRKFQTGKLHKSRRMWLSVAVYRCLSLPFNKIIFPQVSRCFCWSLLPRFTWRTPKKRKHLLHCTCTYNCVNNSATSASNYYLVELKFIHHKSWIRCVSPISAGSKQTIWKFSILNASCSRAKQSRARAVIIWWLKGN